MSRSAPLACTQFQAAQAAGQLPPARPRMLGDQRADERDVGVGDDAVPVVGRPLHGWQRSRSHYGTQVPRALPQAMRRQAGAA